MKSVQEEIEMMRGFIRRKRRERTAFPLHIVQLESIHPLYASDILSKGVLVYERQVQ